jgi:mono/diheme cytochrome c family protein
MRNRIVLLFAAVLSASACDVPEHRSEPPLRELGPPPRPVTLLSGQPPTPPLKALMKDHALNGITMRDAVGRGDVDVAKRAAQALAQLHVEGNIPPGAGDKLSAMNLAAERASTARNVDEAAAGLAEITRTCGDCHATQGGPRAALGTPPSDEPSVAPRMSRHQWAVTRLWEGLVAPSDQAWLDGARVLADAPLEPEAFTPGKSPVAAIGTLAARVHDLGGKAATVSRSEDRGRLFAELMSTCAACHERVRRGGQPAAKTK